jgi:hypothetical protein
VVDVAKKFEVIGDKRCAIQTGFYVVDPQEVYK